MLVHTGLNKLDGLGPIYIINMEKSLDRKTYIENHFKKYGVSEYKFIKAIDGSKEDLSKTINNIDKLVISQNEMACSISHLKAIETWLEESDSEYAIIMEDDISLETINHWSFTWKDFFDSVTQKYDILQLAIINNFMVNPRLHLREFLDWSAAAYLIKRDYAKNLIKRHKTENGYVLSRIRHLAISEGVLFARALCYSIPLFTYSLDLGSSLNPDHVETVHKNSKKQTLNYWKNNSFFKPDLI